jgi:hypothetical protein
MSSEDKPGWKSYEVSGIEVYGSVEDLEAKKPLTGNLRDGQEIVVANISAWQHAKVSQDKYGDVYAENDGFMFTLTFCSTRKCWASNGIIAKEAIKKLKLGGPDAE